MSKKKTTGNGNRKPVIVSTKATQAPQKAPPAPPKAPPAPPRTSEIDPELPEELPEELADVDDPTKYSETAIERRKKQRAAVLEAKKAGTYP